MTTKKIITFYTEAGEPIAFTGRLIQTRCARKTEDLNWYDLEVWKKDDGRFVLRRSWWTNYIRDSCVAWECSEGEANFVSQSWYSTSWAKARKKLQS